MQFWFEYAIIWLLTLLCIFAFLIGHEKMVKIVIGNYILSIISLWFSTSINILIQWCLENPDASFLAITSSKWQAFFEAWQFTLGLALYAWLLFILFTKVDLHIHIPRNELKKNIVMVSLIPLTVWSVIFGLEIVLLGSKVFHIPSLVLFASEVANNQVMYNFLILSPLWIMLHWLASLAITTQLEISYSPPLDYPSD